MLHLQQTITTGTIHMQLFFAFFYQFKFPLFINIHAAAQAEYR